MFPRRFLLGAAAMCFLACEVVLLGCGGGARRPSQPATPVPEPTPARLAPTDASDADASARPYEGSVPEGPSGVIHRVAPGETLWAIAQAYGLTVARIAEANDLVDVDRIEVGQELLIPESGFLLAWPIRGEILSGYGAPRHGRRHSGVDIRGEPGELVTAAAAGTVVYASAMRGYGKTVILDHGDGIETLYAHARELLVRLGDRVSSGDAIARVGRTGNATTDHCHFEVRRDDVSVDPLRFLSR